MHGSELSANTKTYSTSTSSLFLNDVKHFFTDSSTSFCKQEDENNHVCCQILFFTDLGHPFKKKYHLQQYPSEQKYILIVIKVNVDKRVPLQRLHMSTRYKL